MSAFFRTRPDEAPDEVREREQAEIALAKALADQHARATLATALSIGEWEFDAASGQWVQPIGGVIDATAMLWSLPGTLEQGAPR